MDQSNASSTTKALKIQTTAMLGRSNTQTQTHTHMHIWVTSPVGKWTLPSLHSTGPVKPRTKPLPVTSPIVTLITTTAVTPHSLPLFQISPPMHPASPKKKKISAPAPLEHNEPKHKPTNSTKPQYKAPEEPISIKSPTVVTPN